MHADENRTSPAPGKREATASSAIILLAVVVLILLVSSGSLT
jgi:hypothetical protein